MSEDGGRKDELSEEESLDEASLNHSLRAFWTEIVFQQERYDMINPKRIDVESNRDTCSVMEDLDVYCENGLVDKTQKGNATPNYYLTSEGEMYAQDLELDKTHLISGSSAVRYKPTAD